MINVISEYLRNDTLIDAELELTVTVWYFRAGSRFNRLCIEYSKGSHHTPSSLRCLLHTLSPLFSLPSSSLFIPVSKVVRLSACRGAELTLTCTPSDWHDVNVSAPLHFFLHLSNTANQYERLSLWNFGAFMEKDCGLNMWCGLIGAHSIWRSPAYFWDSGEIKEFPGRKLRLLEQQGSMGGRTEAS